MRNSSQLSNNILDNIGNLGQTKRRVYQRRLPSNSTKDYYYIMRDTGNTEPVIVEYGFIDNKNDSVKLNKNIEDYVEGVVLPVSLKI